MNSWGAGCSVREIVSLVQLAAGVYSSFKEIYNTTACDDAKRLEQELFTLSRVLNGFRTLIEVSDSEEKHHEQGDRIPAAMREELQMLIQESHSSLGSLKVLVDQGKHRGHPGAIIWLRKLTDIEHLTQKWDMSLLRINLASNTPPPLDGRLCGMGEKGWRIHDETKFAIIDPSTTSNTLIDREHIPEGATNAEAEAGPLQSRRRHEEDRQNYLFAVMGVTGAGESSFIRAGQEEHESEANQIPTSGIRGYWTLLFLERLRHALQEKLPDRYRTSFDGFDGSCVPVRQIQALKHGSAYHLEANSNVFLDEADLNLFLSSESPIQTRNQPRNGGDPQPRDGGALQPRDGGTPRPGPLRICDHKINHGSPATYKGIGMDEMYPDAFHPRIAAYGHIVSNPAQPKSSQKWFDLGLTMAAPTALISALCMHNYNANRHDQPAGYLMRPIPIWSAIDNPSPPMLVAATMTHGIATLTYYALRPGDRFRESFLGIALVSAGAAGYGIGADTESVLIGILPLVTTMSLLICTLMNLLLKGCGVGSRFEEGRERDLEKQSGK